MLGIANERPNLIGILLVLLEDFFEVDAIRQMKSRGNQLLVFGESAIQLLKIAVDEIGYAHTPPRDLIFVARTDPARSRPNGNAPFAPFRDLFNRPMKRKDDVRPVADFKLRSNIDAHRF